ncbi:hypothetical protein ACFWBF_26700 [Streptomyces sp. NPDC060028]|uniref:hypothetical protein n=1 Tax=Streptomyces sp. NPDC060028 TaxID=3347041 RepID=UPI0036CCFEEF
MTARWEELPSGVRGQVDAYVLQDSRFQAVRIVWETGRARGIGLAEAQEMVHRRYEHFGARVPRTPGSPLDLDSLAARAGGIRATVVAIEAVWDGDTEHDWFVKLLAVAENPAGDHHLATVHHHMGREAAAAEAGRSLAEHLGVPFHFASPDTPDDEAPRWRV